MNALVTLESILTPETAPFSADTLFGTGYVEKILTAIETQVRGEVIDISTPDGRKAAKSLAYKVARSKTILDEIGKEHVAEIKAQSAKIDAERKTLRDRLDGLKAEVSGPVEQWEQAEADRVSGHEGALVAVIETARQAAGKSASLIRELIEIVAGYSARDWQEFKERADVAVTEALATLNGTLADAEQREKDAAELEALRAEKAARDARDAEEREKAARDLAEQQRIAREAIIEQQRAEQAAERERQHAERLEAMKREQEELAKRQAEEAAARAVEQERARVAAEEAHKAAEKAAQEAAEQKRQENQRHRTKVHKKIITALCLHGVTSEAADEITRLIVEGKIPHLSVTY